MRPLEQDICLSQQTAGAQRGDEGIALAAQMDPTRLDEIERFAGAAAGEDRLSLGKGVRTHLLGDPLQDVVGQFAE
jgi:hypothetical protein